MKKISICVVGAGKWGLNHIKTLMELNVNVGCIDVDSQKLKNIKSLFNEIECFKSTKESFKKDFDGYIIATPAKTLDEIVPTDVDKN